MLNEVMQVLYYIVALVTKMTSKRTTGSFGIGIILII